MTVTISKPLPDLAGDINFEGPTVGKKTVVCAILFIPILAWLWFWPYTGDGDSVMHFLAARGVWAEPSVIFGSWSRPLHKALIIIPAIYGIFPARLTQAVVTMILAWQTISLAADLKLRNALLAAPLLVLQPYVFTLASDTMTEIPMALALVIAIRLWMSGRVQRSCVVVSLLPLLRPEGFFFIAMWGILLLLPRLPGDGQRQAYGKPFRAWPGLDDFVNRRFFPMCLLSVGLILWVLGCSCATGDPIYFISIWSWPMQSYAAYQPGPIYHYFASFPIYCGAVFIGPFLIGIWPSLRHRKMWMVWTTWLLVIVLHSLLYWLHKFASVGLLRILACTSPMTAIICLEGFNTIGLWLGNRGYSAATRYRLTLAALAVAMLWSMIFYVIIGEHYHCFGYLQLAREARSRNFLAEYEKQRFVHDPQSPRIIAGDQMFLAVMGLISRPPHYMACTMDMPEQAQRMAAQPIGTIGAWDNEQAVWWHTVTIDDLPSLGYTIVYEYDQTVPAVKDCWKRGSLFSRQRYVLIRKDR